MTDDTPIEQVTQAVHVVFDGPPSHESGRFVECETPDGRSINAGEWHEREDGLWELRIDLPRLASQASTDRPTSEQQAATEKLRAAFMRIQRLKRGDEQPSAPAMQPFWDAINAIPDALYYLDRTPEFEADLAAEEAEDRITTLEAKIAGLQAAMRERAEQVISAWAFVHNIDGAARNDLFARLRAEDRGEGEQS